MPAVAMPAVVERKWTQPTPNRSCGECYACCVHLGITALKKYAGQTCKHLNGNNPTKRCSIYNSRPEACSGYECGWKAGFGPDSLRPDKSGILITPYIEDEGHIGCTVTISKEEGTQQAMHVATEILLGGIITEVRLIYRKSNKAILLKDGNIYKCTTLPNAKGDYEALAFIAGDPVGKYELRKEPE